MLDNKTFLAKIKSIILKLDSSSSFNPNPTIDDQEALSNENFEYGMNALENAIPSHEASSADDVSYDNADSGLEATNVQDAIDEIAHGGGGGSSLPDVYVSSTASDNPGAGGETYTSPVFRFGDTIDNIVAKIGNGSFNFKGQLLYPGTMGQNSCKIECMGTSVIPKATIEGYEIPTLSDAIMFAPVIITSFYPSFGSVMPSGWGNGFVYYTDGDTTSETYGQIIELQM